MASKRDQNELDDLGMTADGAPSPEEVLLGGAGNVPTEGAEEPRGESVEIQRLREEADSWKDKFLRAKAEQQNALRRAAAERDEMIRYGNAGLLRGLLAMLDDLDRAIEAAEQSPSVDSLLEGARLVRQNFDKLLAEHHVKVIDAEGKPFDPQWHEAVMQRPTKEHPPGTVLQQVQRGYQFHDRVLRPAKVIVAGPPAEEGQA